MCPGAFIEKDLSAVFNTADFADTAVVDQVHRVNGIYEDDTTETDRSDNRVVLTIRPTFLCPTSSVVREGSNIYVRGTNYRAIAPDRDGTGVTMWQLVKV